MMRYVLAVILAVVLAGAIFIVQMRGSGVSAADLAVAEGPATIPANAKQATFAAGCFWGVQDVLRKIPGVIKTEAGYSGGHTANPTYRDVCTDLTGHAESVLVTYDPAKVSYAELLDAFWSLHDPTTVDSQGPDYGTQYRSVIFYHDAEQEKVARASLKEVEESHVFKGKIVTQIVPAAKFYTAEEYHQLYFLKQGEGQTCHNAVSVVHTELAKEAAKARENVSK